MILVPLIDLKSLARVCSRRCRDFKSAALVRPVFGPLCGWLAMLPLTAILAAVPQPSAMPHRRISRMSPATSLTLSVRIERWPIAGSFTIARGAKTEAIVVVAEVSDGVHTGRGE